MRKKFLVVVFLFVMAAIFENNTNNLFQPITVEAASEQKKIEIDGITYSYYIETDDNGEDYISSFAYKEGASENTKISIPSKIGDLQVRTIGKFAYPDGLQQHPETIKSISLDLSEHDVCIEDSAFIHCSNLSEFIAKGEHTLTVGESSFLDTKVKEITFDCDVIMDAKAFATENYLGAGRGTEMLETLIFNGDVQLYSSALLRCRGLKNVSFNGENVVIGYRALYGPIENITFNENNKKVILEKDAFYNVFTVNTGSSIEFLGGKVYCYRRSLSKGCSNITFNNEETYICDDFVNYQSEVWDGNSSIKKIVFNSKNVYFESKDNSSNAFCGAPNLQDIVFGFTTENVSGILKSDGNIAYKNMYFLNLDTNVDLSDETTIGYTLYGNKSNSGIEKFSKSNKNIVFEDVQDTLTAKFIGSPAYIDGEKISKEDLKVEQLYKDGSSHIISESTENTSGYTISYYDENGNSIDSLVEGNNKVKISFGSCSCVLENVKAYKKKIQSYKIEYVGGTKIEGQSVKKEDIKVSVVYNNGKEVLDLDNSKYEIPQAVLAEGDNKIPVVIEGLSSTLDGKEISVTVPGVIAREITEMVAGIPENAAQKYVGDKISKTDFIVKATYNDGSCDENYTDYTLNTGEIPSVESTFVFTSANGVECKLSYSAIPLEMTGITAGYNSTRLGENNMVVGQKINPDYLTVTLHYNSGKEEALTTGYTYDKTYVVSLGLNVIKVTYQQFETTFDITGISRSFDKLIAEKSEKAKSKEWFIGDVVTEADFVVMALYNDDTTEPFENFKLCEDTVKLEHEVNTIKFVDKADPDGTKYEYKGFEATPVVVSRIEAVYDTASYPVEVGKNVDSTKIDVTAYFNNGTKEEHVKNFELANYDIKSGYNEVVVQYSGVECKIAVLGVVFNPTATSAPTNAVTEAPTATVTPTTVPEGTVTATPVPTNGVTDVPTATVTPKPTATPKVTMKATPVPTNGVTDVPTATVTPKPTATPKVTMKVKPTTAAKVTPKAVSVKLTSSNKNIKISSKKAYSVVTRKNVSLKLSVKNTSVKYQVVKKGTKLSSKSKAWKKYSKNGIKITKQGAYIVYLKYTDGKGKSVVKHTSGFVIDKKGPVISQKSRKLKITDKESGVKSITVNGKKVKNGYVMKKEGRYKVTATDKAGNKSEKVFVVEYED